MIIKLRNNLKFMKFFNIIFIIYCFIFCVSLDTWLVSVGSVTIKDCIMLFLLFFIVLFRVLLVTPNFFNKYINFTFKIIHLFYYYAVISMLWSTLDYFLHYGTTIVGLCLNGVEFLSVIILCLLKIMFINLYDMFFKRFKLIDLKKGDKYAQTDTSDE